MLMSPRSRIASAAAFLSAVNFTGRPLVGRDRRARAATRRLPLAARGDRHHHRQRTAASASSCSARSCWRVETRGIADELTAVRLRRGVLAGGHGAPLCGKPWTRRPESDGAFRQGLPRPRRPGAEHLVGCGLVFGFPSVAGHVSVRGGWDTRDVSLKILTEPRRVARDPERRVPATSPRTGWGRPGADTEEDPSMVLHRNQPSSPPLDALPVAGLVRSDWVLAVCVVCGHERSDGERDRASCPRCGAQLHSFPLYRDLHAGR
jgi:hypothetical protein